MLADLVVLLEVVGLGGRDEGGKSLSVLGADLGQGGDSGGLLVDGDSNTALA